MDPSPSWSVAKGFQPRDFLDIMSNQVNRISLVTLEILSESKTLVLKGKKGSWYLPSSILGEVSGVAFAELSVTRSPTHAVPNRLRELELPFIPQLLTIQCPTGNFQNTGYELSLLDLKAGISEAISSFDCPVLIFCGFWQASCLWHYSHLLAPPFGGTHFKLKSSHLEPWDLLLHF